jgi:hypothetical protein
MLALDATGERFLDAVWDNLGQSVSAALTLPEPGEFGALAERSFVVDQGGAVLATLHAGENRRIVELDGVPDHVWQAILAAEDRRFFEHEGYDPRAISRAATENLQAGDLVQGGSTITQQLAKTFVGDEAPQEKAQCFIDLIYETKDGYISVAVQTDRQWSSLARALDRPEWLEDARFRTAAGRQEHIDARLELTQEVLRSRTSAEWLDRLDAEDVPCAPVLRRRDVISHPQVRANESVVEIDHPVAGRLRQARPAARFSKTPAEIRTGGPLLGEHTAEILDSLGYSRLVVEELRQAGVIGAPETA